VEHGVQVGHGDRGVGRVPHEGGQRFADVTQGLGDLHGVAQYPACPELLSAWVAVARAGKFGTSAAIGQVLPPKAQMVQQQDWKYVSGGGQVRVPTSSTSSLKPVGLRQQD